MEIRNNSFQIDPRDPLHRQIPLLAGELRAIGSGSHGAVIVQKAKIAQTVERNAGLDRIAAFNLLAGGGESVQRPVAVDLAVITIE